jgi:hypothetical protein
MNQHRKSGDGDSQKRRLRVLGEFELVFGALETEAGDGKTEGVVGFFKDAAACESASALPIPGA